MANGDLAASKGIPAIPGTADRGQGFDAINRGSDLLVTWATRHGPEIEIWVQPTAPAHAAGRVWIKTT